MLEHKGQKNPQQLKHLEWSEKTYLDLPTLWNRDRMRLAVRNRGLQVARDERVAGVEEAVRLKRRIAQEECEG